MRFCLLSRTWDRIDCLLFFFIVRWIFAGAIHGLHRGSHTGYGTSMSPERRDWRRFWSGYCKTILGIGTE